MRINIKTDNAAFDPEPNPELARILHDFATSLEHSSMGLNGYNTGGLYDVNGNKVGTWELGEHH